MIANSRDDSGCVPGIPSRAALTVAVLGVLVMAGIVVLFADHAFAQANPFGGARPPAGPPETGLIGWILAKQNEFYRQFSGLIRAAKADGSAVWTLMGVSFLYGIFHAAGPGHGKAVISSYLVANEETWRRGIVLSFASAILQALVAIAIIAIAAAALQATARTMNNAVRVIEIASYALIALMGARLTVVKGRGLIAALRAWRTAPAPEPPACAHHDHGPDACCRHDVAAHAHAHHGHAHEGHAHDEPARDDHVYTDPAAPHVHDDHCGHNHGPAPQYLAGPGGWKRGLTAIFAVGLRPCSGAILVLVFALAHGLFWAGVAATFMMGLGTAITVAAIATIAVGAKGLATRFAATRSGAGTPLVRAIETGAAVLVLVFGVALLLGYMTSERIVGI
jgi:nickel/cobalt transporter (NicO) family protein